MIAMPPLFFCKTLGSPFGCPISPPLLSHRNMSSNKLWNEGLSARTRMTAGNEPGKNWNPVIGTQWTDSLEAGKPKSKEGRKWEATSKASETREGRTGWGTSAGRIQHLGGPGVTAELQRQCVWKLKLELPHVEGHCLLLFINQNPQVGVGGLEPKVQSGRLGFGKPALRESLGHSK